MKAKKLAVVSLLGLIALASCGTDKVRPVKVLVEDWTGDFSEVAPTTNLANGVKNFAASSADDRKEILGLLEKYTVDNFLGGIPYRDNSGYVLYNSRLVIPSDTFVPGYGYGVGEAEVTGPLTAPGITPAHNMYYHTWNSNYPSTINYLDGKDSVTGDLHAFVSSSYWSTRFTEDKTGYEWYPQLATEDRPQPLNLVGGLATKWRVKVNVGGDLKYNTLSTLPALQGFKGRAVELADYLTPYKLMLNQKWFRSTDLGSQTSGFKGVNEYLASEAKNWANVGVQLNEEEQAIEFEFNTAKTPFYAMYNLSSSLFTPIPEDFITAIGGAANYGTMDNAQDKILSLGTYLLESVETNKEVVFKKNPLWIEADNYKLAGYKYTILESNNVAFEEFLAGKLDSAGVPSAKLQQYKTDPRARQTLGDTVWKLQVNAADPTRWDELFGAQGAISPGSEWELKPVMSNRNFLEGLYYSLDRNAIALETGSRPAPAFFSDAYMINPEEGESWRGTDEGKAVVAHRSPATNGYSLSVAQDFFREAMDELVEAGVYKRTVDRKGKFVKPETITLRFIMQTQSQVDAEGKTLERFMETAFNGADTGFLLDVQPYATTNWMDAYYAPMAGEFDLAFGSISGNTLDPISFLDTVSSTNKSGFTLSWGMDTTLPSADITFKGEHYSFDALQTAAGGLTVLKDGVPTPEFEVLDFGPGTTIDEEGNWVFGEDGSVDIEILGAYYAEDPNFIVEVLGASVIFYDEEFNVLEAAEPVVTVEQADGEWSVLIETIIEPEGAVYMDIVIHYTKTFGAGFPEAVDSLLEFWAPSA